MADQCCIKLGNDISVSYFIISNIYPMSVSGSNENDVQIVG